MNHPEAEPASGSVRSNASLGQENVKDTVCILDLYNLKAGWKTSAAQMPTARGELAAGLMGKKVYTFGGEGNKAVESGVFDQVEAYDTVTD
jgi:N-acetylneuraminic acid mutarotase